MAALKGLDCIAALKAFPKNPSRRCPPGLKNEVSPMHRRLLAVMLLLVALLVGCPRTPPRVAVAPKNVDDTPRYQGLTAAERRLLQLLSRGK